MQLVSLALISRCAAGHYLFATAIAIEFTLLHNFVWHLHYTWRYRRESVPLRTQLLRFHLSNGLVSMVGNLILMRTLVHRAHLPLLVANGIAILCCSVVNFCLADLWVFAEDFRLPSRHKRDNPRQRKNEKMRAWLVNTSGQDQ